MDTQEPAANDNTEPAPERPPFNEVSVLFPLLTFYTVAYLGLMPCRNRTKSRPEFRWSLSMWS